MKIKAGKFEAEVSGWLILLVVLAADNMYANHCNTKRSGGCIESVEDLNNENEES